MSIPGRPWVPPMAGCAPPTQVDPSHAPRTTPLSHCFSDASCNRLGSGAEKLGNYFVGQIVGATNETKPAASVVYDMVDEFITAIEPASYRTNA